jgi:hypothetical protein
MKPQRLLIALTVVNLLLLTYSLIWRPPVLLQGSSPILRGSALEIVDDRGRVRASITVLPANPDVKMPDGTTGYPETVLLRLIDSRGRPNIKIAATEQGAVAHFGGNTDPTGISLQAQGATTSMVLTNVDGTRQLIKP